MRRGGCVGACGKEKERKKLGSSDMQIPLQAGLARCYPLCPYPIGYGTLGRAVIASHTTTRACTYTVRAVGLCGLPAILKELQDTPEVDTRLTWHGCWLQ